MNKEDFTYLLTHPEKLDGTYSTSVGNLVAEYPYFQSARALYLKCLKSEESFKYNQELKLTAAYTTDRSILFDFITSEKFNQNEISQLIKKNTEHLKSIDVTDADDISVNKSVLIDDALKQHMKDSERVFDPSLFEVKPAFQPLANKEQSPSNPNEEEEEEDKKNDPSPEEQLKIGSPLEFDRSETHSFTEWLKMTSFQPIKRGGEELNEEKKETPQPKPDNNAPTPNPQTKQESKLEPKPESALDKKLDLIDRFISSNPKIAPVREATPSINLAQTQLVQNDNLMTETLARIYLEQKNYQKAIQSYRILILKYPEKSSFFADQIKAVKQLQENNSK